jgi:hypothetical protein
MPHGHAAPNGKAALDGYAEIRGVRPGEPIQPLQVHGVVDVIIFVDFLDDHPVRPRIGGRQSE